MSQIVSKKFLLAAILLVALVAVYVEAQRYGGGYGGGRGYGGGYGGGRGYGGGYGGRGGYGGGYGRGGYGGGRGYYGGNGGYGRGGYGGGYGGYRGSTSYYNNDQSMYPSYGLGGGSYNELDDDTSDYSTYSSSASDVYATSSASSTDPTVSSSTGSQTAASSTNNQATLATPTDGRGRPEQRFNPSEGWAQQGDMSPQWYLNQQGFDLVTGGDSSSSSSGDDRNTNERPSERHTLASNSRAAGQLSSSSVAPINNMPKVPTSTTTAAPDFIMINPAVSS